MPPSFSTALFFTVCSLLTLVRANPIDPSFNHTLAKRSRDCGTYTLDCQAARGACLNACYYQNCVVKGNPTYSDVGNDPGGSIKSKNRIQAGTSVSGVGATCEAFPISAKCYDPQDPTGRLGLETDEFPMAQMQQNDFAPGQIRNTLRCILPSENQSGGSQYVQWRLGQGAYGPNGKRASDRTCEGVLQAGDSYKLAFDNAGDIPFCNGVCDNDGQQFHMTNLRPASDGNPGTMNWPYDITKDNTYRITTESADLDAYRATLHRSGQDGLHFDVELFQANGLQVASQSFDTVVGTQYHLDGPSGLPQGFYFTPNAATVPPGTPPLAGILAGIDFRYGNLPAPPGGKQFSAFGWDTEMIGIDKRVHGSGQYCTVINTVPENPENAPDELTWECWFPGY